MSTVATTQIKLTPERSRPSVRSRLQDALPKIVLARMSVNILLNELIGIVPVVGDAFSFWFKSNVRNYQLVKEHMGAPRKSKRSDWVFVIGVLLALGVVVCAGIAVSLFFLQQVIKLLSGR